MPVNLLVLFIVVDEAPVRKPISIHEQTVSDAQGRLRFHGAFTGGFSAGYFNSVGTKEGILCCEIVLLLIVL